MIKRSFHTVSLALFFASASLMAEEIPVPEFSEWSTAGREGRISASENTLKLNNESSEGLVNVTNEIDLNPAWASITVSAKIKIEDYVQGSQVWGGVGIMVTFIDDAGDALGAAALSLKLQGITESFEQVERQLNVPAGATRLRLEPGFYFSSGRAEIADLKVTVEE